MKTVLYELAWISAQLHNTMETIADQRPSLYSGCDLALSLSISISLSHTHTHNIAYQMYYYMCTRKFNPYHAQTGLEFSLLHKV